MMPNIIYQRLVNDSQLETLLGGSGRIHESQSVDKRVSDNGFFVLISFEETLLSAPSKLSRGPRTITISVHRPWEIDRDYDSITAILNRIDELILPIEDESGTDGIRVTSIRRGSPARSANHSDEGYKTATRWATYGVLYQEYAA